MTATDKYCAVIFIQHDGALWGRKQMLLNICEWFHYHFCAAINRAANSQIPVGHYDVFIKRSCRFHGCKLQIMFDFKHEGTLKSCKICSP
jgi:hypothetical protein